MLTRIHVDNYKCLTNFDLRLSELTLLLGGNGCGKSAVFEVVNKLREFLRGESRVDRLFSATDLTSWTTRSEQCFELELSDDDDALTYELTIEHHAEKKTGRVKTERLTAGSKPLFSFDLGKVQLYRDDHSAGPTYSYDWTQSGLALVGDRPDNRRLCRFRDAIRGFQSLSLCSARISGVSEGESDVLAHTGENFPSWYRGRLQENPEHVQHAVSRLQDVLPGFAGLHLSQRSGDHRELLARFAPPGETAVQSYRFDRLSDGQRALIVLYMLTFTDEPAGIPRTLFLDEPDNYVTLPELQPWLAALEDGCGVELPQTVIISHHPEAIDFLSDKAVWLARGPERQTRIVDVENDTGLRLSELHARGWAP